MTKSGASLLVIFILLFSTVASRATQQEKLVFPEISSPPLRLLNGLTAYVARTTYLGDTMTIGLVVRYGSAFDLATKGGIAYLASQMFGKSTEERTTKDIQDELNYLGATLEVRCDWDGIRFLIRGQSDTYERCLLLLYQIVCEAKFNDEDFAKVKAAQLQQIQAPEDPRQRARSRLEAELFRGTTYGRPIRGTAASIQNIEVGDVRYFYHKFFSPDQASLVVVGSAPADAVLQKTRRIWGVWVQADEVPSTFKPPVDPAGRSIFLEDDPGSPAAQFILGNLWPSREDPIYYAGMLAARILQTRLTQALPTSLLTVAAEPRRLQGPFYIQGQAAADQAGAEISKILDVVEAFKASTVTAEEASKAQNLWIEEFGKTINSTDGICSVLLDSELYRLGTNYLSTFTDFVRRCTPAMIQEAAKSCLFPGGVVMIVRGPAATLQPQLESLGTVQPVKR